VILHIPHASTQTLDYKISNRDREIQRMTDWHTNDLYDVQDSTKIIFPLSRLICDVERFEDDKLEAMSRFGMGVCYTRDTQGEELRHVKNDERKYIIKTYYRPHHQKLSEAVDKELQEKASALIIDCHSFPDVSYYFNSDFKKKRPDICIGTDSFHSPVELIKRVRDFFAKHGYTVEVDKPYSGTMVPLKHYKKEPKVQSLMIEINRKLYMDADGVKNVHYSRLKHLINQILTEIKLSQ